MRRTTRRSASADVPPDVHGDDRDDASDPTAPPGTFKALKAQAERQIVLDRARHTRLAHHRSGRGARPRGSLQPAEDHAPPQARQGTHSRRVKSRRRAPWLSTARARILLGAVTHGQRQRRSGSDTFDGCLNYSPARTYHDPRVRSRSVLDAAQEAAAAGDHAAAERLLREALALQEAGLGASIPTSRTRSTISPSCASAGEAGRRRAWLPSGPCDRGCVSSAAPSLRGRQPQEPRGLLRGARDSALDAAGSRAGSGATSLPSPAPPPPSVAPVTRRCEGEPASVTGPFRRRVAAVWR